MTRTGTWLSAIRGVGRMAATAAPTMLCLVFVFAHSASAQHTNGRSSRKVCTPFGCKIEHGFFSTVCIGRDKSARPVFLTCAHCVSGAQEIHVGYREQWTPASVIGVGNNGVDLALLVIETNEMRGCLPISESSPAANERVEITAYPGTGTGGARIRSSSVNQSDGRTLWVNCPFALGESGGAVVCRGEIIGIISSTPANPITGQPTGKGPGACVAAETIHDFVVRTLGHVPTCDDQRRRPQGRSGRDDEAKKREIAPPPPDEPNDALSPRPDPISKPAPISTPRTAPRPMPRSQAARDACCGCEDLRRQMAAMSVEIQTLRSNAKSTVDLEHRIAILEREKTKKIPIEFHDPETGAVVDRREFALGEPIPFFQRQRKVK